MATDFVVGSKYIVKNLTDLDVLVKRRLQDFGVTTGAEITVKSKAPLGAPVLFEINGQALAIRKKEARKIGVEVINGNCFTR